MASNSAAWGASNRPSGAETVEIVHDQADLMLSP